MPLRASAGRLNRARTSVARALPIRLSIDSAAFSRPPGRPHRTYVELYRDLKSPCSGNTRIAHRFSETWGGTQTAFVHVTAVRGHELLEVGDRVRFDLEENPKGPRAVNVERIAAEGD